MLGALHVHIPDDHWFCSRMAYLLQLKLFHVIVLEAEMIIIQFMVQWMDQAGGILSALQRQMQILPSEDHDWDVECPKADALVAVL
ncbi:hypothetical protein Dimus_028150 [Dionaea muscipula]